MSAPPSKAVAYDAGEDDYAMFLEQIRKIFPHETAQDGASVMPPVACIIDTFLSDSNNSPAARDAVLTRLCHVPELFTRLAWKSAARLAGLVYGDTMTLTPHTPAHVFANLLQPRCPRVPLLDERAVSCANYASLGQTHICVALRHPFYRRYWSDPAAISALLFTHLDGANILYRMSFLCAGIDIDPDGLARLVVGAFQMMRPHMGQAMFWRCLRTVLMASVTNEARCSAVRTLAALIPADDLPSWDENDLVPLRGALCLFYNSALCPVAAGEARRLFYQITPRAHLVEAGAAS